MTPTTHNDNNKPMTYMEVSLDIHSARILLNNSLAVLIHYLNYFKLFIEWRLYYAFS